MKYTWHEKKNETPTFELSSVEKPDFSPYLIHMTGKKSLLDILSGKNHKRYKNLKEERKGYLKSSIPKFDSKKINYNSKVVCFTETPIFGLDFFRYRSYRRWQENQQFGIGFSKAYLIKKMGVRPVIYLDSERHKTILGICDRLNNKDIQISNRLGKDISKEYRKEFKKIKPLLFPLLENTPKQGFMWEREWRFTSKKGLVFPYESIELICCPKNERKSIEKVLRPILSTIEIVESWKEYNEITSFLKRRKSETDKKEHNKFNKPKYRKSLVKLQQQNLYTLGIVNSYFDFAKKNIEVKEEIEVQELIQQLKNNQKKIIKEIQKIDK